MDEIEIRPSVANEVQEMFPELNSTVRAWSVYYKGQLACVAGVAITPALMLAFMQIKQGVTAPKMIVWRCAKIIWEKMKGLGYPRLYAIADPELWTAPQFLTRLGFRHIESSARGEVFVWETQ